MIEGLGGDATEDPEVGLALLGLLGILQSESRAVLIVEAIKLLAAGGSSAVVAVDGIVVGIVVAIVAVVGPVNYLMHSS